MLSKIILTFSLSLLALIGSARGSAPILTCSSNNDEQVVFDFNLNQIFWYYLESGQWIYFKKEEIKNKKIKSEGRSIQVELTTERLDHYFLTSSANAPALSDTNILVKCVNSSN